MKKKNLNAIILLITVTSTAGLSSCATWDKLDRTEQGALIGAGGGAVIGSAVGGTKGAVIGGVAGGVAGGAVGKNTR